MGSARVVDVEVEARGDATVGDLADALARVVDASPGATVAVCWPPEEAGPAPPRAARLADRGPAAGATVALVPPSTDDAATAPSPVLLVGADDRRRLVYGTTDLGGVVVRVGRQVTVRTDAGAAASVDGAPVLGSARLEHGDLLVVGDGAWTVHVEAALRPPWPGGWTRPHLARPAVAQPYEPVEVRLPAPPAAHRLPGFPVLSATVPLLMGLVLWFVTRSWLSAGFMLFSVVFVVASGLEARREARAEARAGVREFREQLADAERRLVELADGQRRRHAAAGWSPRELAGMAATPPGDPVAAVVWSRGLAGAPIRWTARLGTAALPLQDRLVVPDQGRRDLHAEVAELAQRHEVVRDDVVVVDLAEHGGLVIEGVGGSAAAIARSVAMQLAVAVGPDRLRIELATGADRADTWHELGWLPHLRTRHGRRLVVVDGATATPPTDRHPDDLVLWVTTPEGERPDDVRATLTVAGALSRLVIASGDGWCSDVDLSAEPLSAEECEPLARRLAARSPATDPWPATTDAGTSDATATGGLPDQVDLGDVVADRDLCSSPDALATWWATSASGTTLAAPIGIDAAGATVNLDLAHDGPHVLVAGTTGAGKSELLRTFLVAAALHHSPERLHLLLIDYKGGAAFGPLAALPHTVGTISDLSGALAPRALASLRAELRRREQSVAELGGDRWAGPALFVVVDELATLVAEQPAFVDGLVDLAQRGRSLGVHLVLATQRPAGVVTDAIRANVTTRIALRVADEDDSRDVVDSPVAATLPRDRPGRAVVRSGPGRVVHLQVAHCSGPLPHRRTAVSARVWRPGDDTAAPSDADQPTPGRSAGATQLELAIRTAVAAARLAGVPTPRRPWLDPLPSQLELAPLRGPDRAGQLVVGMVDRPDEQARSPLVLNLARDGGCLVLGAGGSGRSTLVQTLTSAAHLHPEEWQVHVVDDGAALAGLAGLGAVGDVVAVHDAERVLRLLRGTEREIRRRLAAGATAEAAGRRLVVVDGIAAFEERHGRADRGVALDLLVRIARDGRGVGVHLVLTAHRRAEIPLELVGLLPVRLVLRTVGIDEAALLGLDEGAADPELPPGRCHVDGRVGQVAVAAVPTERSTTPAVPRLPPTVRRDQLRADADDARATRLVVGLDADELTVATLDLRHHHAIVAGSPRSGVTTALATLASVHPAATLVGGDDADQVLRSSAAAAAAARRHRPQLVLVDDAHDLLEGPDGTVVAEALEALLRLGPDRPVRLVLGGDVEWMLRSYHDVVTALRRHRSGLLLGADTDLHASLWHADLPPRSDLPERPGRGWLLSPSGNRPVQVAQN